MQAGRQADTQTDKKLSYEVWESAGPEFVALCYKQDGIYSLQMHMR